MQSLDHPDEDFAEDDLASTFSESDSLESSFGTPVSGSPGAARVSGSRKRKCSTPCKSPPANDPNFRGVTLYMENRLVRNQWKLIIHPVFSLSPKKKRFSGYIDTSDDDEPHSSYASLSSDEKHCASCRVKKTPLWRDAEDGTPLCNACGIRYKKYKLRCGSCWHIPKKDEFSPTCYCGAFYEYVSTKR